VRNHNLMNFSLGKSSFEIQMDLIWIKVSLNRIDEANPIGGFLLFQPPTFLYKLHPYRNFGKRPLI